MQRVSAAQKPTKSAKPKGLYSAALTQDLSTIRTVALQAALMQQSEILLDLMRFALTTPCFAGVLPLTDTRLDPEAVKTIAGLILPKGLTAQSQMVPLNAQEATEAFARFRRKTKSGKDKQLIQTLVRRIRIGLKDDSANPMVEQLMEITKADVRSIWTPERTFFARLTKAQLLDIHHEVMGSKTPSTKLAKESKAQIADYLHDLFNSTKAAPTLSEEQQAGVRA
ncbi:hypothetical protein [Pseudaestuariivita rosea]|uniref:hypothetical protein n=1 Tax=Pseudaestuariivita rosea TaxID=2763263 RepID=UPI001ABA5C94|nr:hypothetical protein [Pseudaestuariivita rosea]